MCSRVSLPHLQMLLARTTDPKFDDVKALVATLPQPPQSEATIGLDCDPEFDAIKPRWPQDANNRPSKIGGVALECLRHDQLFYTQRNKLIHELFAPDSSTCAPGKESPYYHRRSRNGEPDTWLLVYPTFFVAKLAGQILTSLSQHYTVKQIDPWKVFDMGTHWIEGLNQPNI